MSATKKVQSYVLPDGRCLGTLKVNDLKEVLEAYNLSKTGNKKDLILRVYEHLSKLQVNDDSVISLDESLEQSNASDSGTIKEPPVPQMEVDPRDDELGALTEATNQPIEDSQPSDEVPLAADAASIEKLSTEQVEESQSAHFEESLETELDINVPNDPISPEKTANVPPLRGKPVPVAEEEDTPLMTTIDQEEDLNSINEDITKEKPQQTPPVALKDKEQNDTTRPKVNKISSVLVCSSSSDDDVAFLNEEKPFKPRHEKNRVRPKPKVVETIDLVGSPKRDPILKRKTLAPGFVKENELPERISPLETPKNPISRYVFIRNLVRPFNLAQLRRLIEDNFGIITDLWLNMLKSCAFIEFLDMSSAVKCREALDGTRWPSASPTVLRVEYGTEALGFWLKTEGQMGDRPPPIKILYPNAFGDNKKNDIVQPTCPSKMTRVIINRNNVDSNQEAEPANVMPIETTDLTVSKKEKSLEPEKPPEKPRNNGKTEESILVEKQQQPVSLLDYFKLTKAEPNIYWMPLTDEQAAAQKKRRELEYEEVLRRKAMMNARNQRSPFDSVRNKRVRALSRSPNRRGSS